MTQHVQIGNLPHDASPEAVRRAVEKDGRPVSEVPLVRDPKMGRPRGFVELESPEEAAAAAVDRLGPFPTPLSRFSLNPTAEDPMETISLDAAPTRAHDVS